ncbi:MAG: hypothetical protein ACE5GJ_02545 [Gemmatimonadota bacterium]
MVEEHPTWRDRYPEGHVTCVRCLEVRDVVELDRLLWCESCRARARNRAAAWGWVAGFAFGLLVAAFVWIAIRPTDLIPGAWLATVAAAVWIGSRIAREIIYGGMRFRNARAVEAVPPAAPPGDEGDPAGRG